MLKLSAKYPAGNDHYKEIYLLFIIMEVTSFSQVSPNSTTSVQSVTLKAFLTFEIRLEMDLVVTDVMIKWDVNQMLS